MSEQAKKTGVKKEPDEKGFFQKFWKKAQTFWPISLLLMTFTFLSQLEKVIEFSDSLSRAVGKWRELLYATFEVPVNALRRMMDLPDIVFLSPWPEVMFMFGAMVYSIRQTLESGRKGGLAIRIWSWFSIPVKKGYWFTVKKTEQLQRWPILGWICSAFAAVVILTGLALGVYLTILLFVGPTAVIFYVLFPEGDTWILSLICFLFLGGALFALIHKVLLAMNILSDENENDPLSGFVTFIVNTSFQIVFAAFVIVYISNLLELALSPLDGVKADATG